MGRRFSLGLLFLLAVFLTAAVAWAGEAPPATGEQKSREIYVPFADLNILLEHQPKRVLLGREEYDELVKKARKAPETHAPQVAAVIAAEYTVSAGQQRAEIQGSLTIDVLEDGLHALPLDVGSVGLRGAQLDGRGAAIGRDAEGRLALFVEGVGRHALSLDMVAPFETTAARQILNFRLPRPAATSLRLTAPGDVEIKEGAGVVSRTVDEAAKVTRFELLPREGDTTIVMTLNSHLQQQQRAVVARSVLIDEVTQGYEKLHATVSLGILYRAVDQFRFVVPEGFEITDVASPLLARWDVQEEGGRRLIHVRLREQTTETVVLNITALRAPSRLDDWHAPRLEPLDVAGSVAVLGLLVEDRLNAESLATEGLIAIDTSVLNQAIPAVLLESGPGKPALRAVAAWYAPQNAFSLAARYQKPPAEIAVTTSLLLIVADKGQEVLGGLSLLPQVEKRFSFDLATAAGWQITSVTAADGTPLQFDRSSAAEDAAADATGYIRVTVPAGMPAGEEFKVNFHATRTPSDWLTEWQSLPVEFPRFAVIGATRDEGAIAVDVRDDMRVRPDKLLQLTPLDAAEKSKYGLADVATTLAYRYESPKYGASLVVERTKPRLSARTFSFLRVDPDVLNCHYELVYVVEEAREQRFALLLPKDTPASVSIAALDGVKLKEFGSEVVGENRRWNVLLAEPQRGRIRLAVDFQQPLPTQEPKGLALPIVVADGVAYQSGLMAFEGCAELEVQVKAVKMGTEHEGALPARRVDVGELAEAEYQPGRRLLGAFGFVGDAPAVTIDVLRHTSYPISPTIVQQCELDTNLSAEGQSQTQARFKLRTKAVYLQVKLPAGAELWSAELDGVPLKPQRDGDSVLIDVPAGTANAVQTLQVVYASPVGAVAMRGTLGMSAPKLLVRVGGNEDAVEVPLADLVWRVHVPSGYDAVQSGGTVATEDVERPLPAVVEVAGALYHLTGSLPLAQMARMTKPVQVAEQSAGPNFGQNSRQSPPPAFTEHHPIGLQQGTAAKKIIERALDSPTALEFVETPLTDVVDYLKHFHGIEIQLDNKALADVGIGSDSPVTKSLKGITLRSALRTVLHELNLTYTIQNELLLITTPEEAESRLETKAYPVGDFVLPPGASEEDQADFDSLIQLITSTVKPTTWGAVGGPGSIEPFENGLSLIVSQTQEVHEEVEAVFKEMRTIMRETGGQGRAVVKRLSKAKKSGGDGKTMGGGMGGMGGGMGGGMAQFGEKESPASKSEVHIAKAEPNRPPQSASDPQMIVSEEEDERVPGEADPFATRPSFERIAGAAPTEKKRADHVGRLARSTVGNVIVAEPSLAGTRSLKIDVVQTSPESEQVLTFRSLGVEPELAVTLVNRSQLSALVWGLALAIGLVGVAMTRQPARKKIVFILTVAILATLIPLLIDRIEVVRLCNGPFYAVALLAPYYLLVGGVQWSVRCARRINAWGLAKFARASLTPSVPVIILLVVVFSTTVAARLQAAAPDSSAGPYVIQVVEPSAPVNVPDDAIILPYDPDSETGVQGATNLLVPYEKYVELWNRANPDKKIETKAAPAPYALAGAEYETLLEGDEYLLLAGQIEIDVFVDGFVQVPVGLGGGVLAQAQLDGKPARLSVAAVALTVFEEAAQQPQQAALAAKPESAADRSMMVVYVSGKGRHKLELSVRLKLSRQGGWRVAEGVLPAAPATAMTIRVPKSHTELRLGRLSDRRSYETEKADESIRTAIDADGMVSIQWRPKVAEGQVDHSLTAASVATLDVQEDGLRLVWQLGLEFRRSQRERFIVTLPAGFLVEKVEGNNVRGWEIRNADQGQTVEVALLQTAKDAEQFTLRLWRSGAVGQGDLAQFDVPVVSVSDAALNSGQLTIRRSPRMELRTLDRSGVTRTDLPADAAGATDSQESPLGIRPFEAYSFAGVPFAVRLAAAPMTARSSVTVQTVLRIAEYERSLESRIVFDVQGRPVYQLQMLLPDDLRVDRVSAPGEFQYAITKQDKRPLLTIYLATGQQGNVPVLVRGKLVARGEQSQSGSLLKRGTGSELADAKTTENNGGEVPVPLVQQAASGARTEAVSCELPRLEAVGVERQQGDIAVQVDPAVDVDATDLKNCEKVLLSSLHGWLNAQQQAVARLGLHYRQGDYAGMLRLIPRQADVVCDTITNVRVTDRAIEETILLDFTIRNAGVRELNFLLPGRMAGSRISVPMLRQKTVVPVHSDDKMGTGTSPDAIATGTVRVDTEPVPILSDSPVRVRIELQDEVMDQLRVLVENDRLLTSGEHEAPIPTVELGRTNRRYVAFESAGRDQVKVDEKSLREMDPLGRQQKEWELLKGIVGREMTMAYLVASDARQPRLAFHTEQHAAVETVGARIGLAETTLVLDANGAYRAKQVLRVDNATEQFLVIRLPQEARLWTARVAGEPVKPTTAANATTAQGSDPGDSPIVSDTEIGTVPWSVRIPLIKTAPGELHYDVVLKYGGKMPAISTLGTVAFPLIHCENIRPELSQVRLYVPKDYGWFDFGGTMRRVGDEADLNAGYVKFQTKQTEHIVASLRQGDTWTRLRAAANLKTQFGKMDEYRSSLASQSSSSELQSELNFNAGMLQRAQQEASEVEKAPAKADIRDNRQQLNTLFQGQKLSRARNVVKDAGANWDEAAEQKPVEQPREAQMFNGEWLRLGKLANSEESSGARRAAGEMASVGFGGGSNVSVGKKVATLGEGKENLRPNVKQQPSATQVAPQAGGQDTASLQGTSSLGVSTVRGVQTLGRAYLPSGPQQSLPEGNERVAEERDDDSVARYKNRLERGASQQEATESDSFASAANAPARPGLPSDDKAPADGPTFGVGINSDAGLTEDSPPAAPPAAQSSVPGEEEFADRSNKPAPPVASPPPATGLASLDFELPQRGELYCFTTPRGEAEITARAFSNDLLRRLVGIALVGVLAVLLWFVARLR